MTDKNDAGAKKEKSGPEKDANVKPNVHQLSEDELTKVSGGRMAPREEMKKKAE